MITVEQIKAARALLNWNQDDLAKSSGMSKPALANLERRSANPRLDTIRAIQKAFETAGVAFIGEEGVKLRGDELRVYILEGLDAIYRLWNDIYDTLDENEERLISGISERKLAAVTKDRYQKAMNRFKRKGITGRVLCNENDNFFPDTTCEYRALPELAYKDIQYYVYKDKSAMLLWEPSPRVVIIKNQAIANSYKTQFEAQWNASNKIKTES